MVDVDAAEMDALLEHPFVVLTTLACNNSSMCGAWIAGWGNTTKRPFPLLAFGSAHASTAVNAAVVAAVAPAALCVDAAGDVLCRL